MMCNRRTAAYLILLTITAASLSLLLEEQGSAFSVAAGIRRDIKNLTNWYSSEVGCSSGNSSHPSCECNEGDCPAINVSDASGNSSNTTLAEQNETFSSDQVSPEDTQEPKMEVELDVLEETIYCDRNASHPICCSEEQCEIVRKSTLYSKCCGNLPSTTIQQAKIYPILITGTPRSGTTFMTMLINKLNGGIVHDWHNVTKNGLISWIHVMNEPTENWFGPAKLQGSKFYSAWHQLRDPLNGLTSMTFSEPMQYRQYTDFLNRHIAVEDQCYFRNQTGYDQYQCLIRQGLQFYNQWHHFIHRLKLRTFQLENLVEDYNMTLLDEIFMDMNLPPPNHNKARMIIQQDGNRRRRLAHTNSRTHRPTLEWWELCQADRILTEEFLQLNQHFGYYHNVQNPCDAAAMSHPRTNYTKPNPVFVRMYGEPNKIS